MQHPQPFAAGSLAGQAPGALADLARLGLTSLASVRKAAGEIGARYGQVDLLVSNAGLMMPPFATAENCAAAAALRDITGGDETVPTVVVREQAMVNPSARQVIAAARSARSASCQQRKPGRRHRWPGSPRAAPPAAGS